MTVREMIEARERQMLNPRATLAAETRGRRHPEPEHPFRTAFQRDRDRIIHCKAFRRLKRKTQVFLAPEGDHYRTRLTHTLEAAQIARTVTRALFLNEDLAEAIALGHDLGHTPFGHSGEAVLNELFSEGFLHAQQSLRVVDLLESTRRGPGLNLTEEVRDGIAHHSKGKDILQGRDGQRAFTLEGQIVSVCDAIAYVNHDIDDALRAGIITEASMPQDVLSVLGHSTSERINTMVTGLIQGSTDGPIRMTPQIGEATNELRTYLYEHVYPSEWINVEIRKAKRLLQQLYFHLVQHPTEEILHGTPEDSIERRTVDFLASMTDQYALNLYARLFFPSGWQP